MGNFFLKVYFKINGFIDKNSERKEIQLKILKVLNEENILNIKFSDSLISIVVLLDKKDYSLNELNVINLELNNKLETLKEELHNYDYKFDFVNQKFENIF